VTSGDAGIPARYGRHFAVVVGHSLASLAAVHHAERRDDGYFYGSAKVIKRSTNGTLAGGADFRREAFALGI